MVGCASLAGIGDPISDEEQTDAGSTGTSGASGTSGTRGVDAGTKDSATTETGVDAAATCMLPKKPNDATCATGSECCSNACAGDRRCRDSCEQGGRCDRSSDCCVNLYCSLTSLLTCQACKLNGQDAEKTVFSGTPVPSSCCSGNVDVQGKCAP